MADVEALQAATAGDLGPVERLLTAVTDTYCEQPSAERYAELPLELAGRYVTVCGN